MRYTRLQLDHVAIPCFDPARTRQFYTEVMGLELIDAASGDNWGGHPWLMLIFAAGDGRQLSFCAFDGFQRPPKEPLPADARHYAFSAPSLPGLSRWKRKLDAAGVKWSEEDHGTQQSIYFRDPNGVMLEITAPRSASVARRNAAAERILRKWVGRSRKVTRPRRTGRKYRRG